MNSILCLSILLLGFGTASAQVVPYLHPFERDLSGLQQGLQIAGFDFNDLAEYSNPFVGKSKFILAQENAPWAGNYYPMAKGGLGNRWQSNSLVNIQSLPTKEKLLLMTASEISLLSPIEKYDIYRGDYNFTATLLEINQRGPLRPWPVEIWEGFCNGVRCAGIHLPEPKELITMINPDGIQVSFQPADLKALAGASYFFVEKYSQMGAPTRGEGFGSQRPHPAIFDMALRYHLAEKKKAFVVDSNLGSEIWNESVVGYQRHLIGPSPLDEQEKMEFPAAVFKTQVHTTLFTLSELNIKRSNRSTTERVAAGEIHKKIKMEYTLYLDGKRMAIDGKWAPTTSYRGVDFVWFSAGKGTDADYPQQNGNQKIDFETIKKLVDLSHQSRSCRRALTL